MAEQKNMMNKVFAAVAVAALAGAGVWMALGQSGGGPGAATSKEPETKGKDKPAAPKSVDLTINAKKFKMDLALDDETRFKGLSDKADIPEGWGLIFVFPRVMTKLDFVMRDCPVPIDVVYLDGAGRVVAWHKMLPEPPRTEEEKVKTAPPGYPAWAATNDAYEKRLKKYSSKFSAQFALEFKGGTTDSLNLKAGQKLDLDVAALKKLAK